MNIGLNFVAIDVELADSSHPESICQIGLAVVVDGEIVEVITHLVNTPQKFGWWQSQNLSIVEADIWDAPDFSEVVKQISHLMNGPVFSHTFYDRNAIYQACNAYGCTIEGTIWLDSAQVARRVWPDKYAKKGFGLKNLAADFEIAFQHHDAGEDARVAAEIVLRACKESSSSVADLIKLVKQPSPSAQGRTKDLRKDGNTDGPLFGEVVVFTGGFSTTKSEQADIAAFAGCTVANGVTKKTTLVVVGDDRFSRAELSTKWRKAEELRRNGQDIQILSESHFRLLIADK